MKPCVERSQATANPGPESRARPARPTGTDPPARQSNIEEERGTQTPALETKFAVIAAMASRNRAKDARERGAAKSELFPPKAHTSTGMMEGNALLGLRSKREAWPGTQTRTERGRDRGPERQSTIMGREVGHTNGTHLHGHDGRERAARAAVVNEKGGQVRRPVQREVEIEAWRDVVGPVFAEQGEEQHAEEALVEPKPAA